MKADQMLELRVPSSLDESEEPSLFAFPEAEGRAPLLVGLHTWSFDRFNQKEKMLPFCEERDWALLLPEFRGPNNENNPRAFEACGSELARQDIIDAVEYVCAEYAVDRRAIFLLGGSGGGHMALMMAGYKPEIWKGVSAWVPITDVTRWHGENENYRPGIEACCGGRPGDSQAVDSEYRDRSPISYAAAIARANVSVHHGRFDGGLPFGHTVALAHEVEKYGPENFFYEIFDGEHEIRYDRAFAWFDRLLTENQKGTRLTG